MTTTVTDENIANIQKILMDDGDAVEKRILPFNFSGNAGEYFGIWIVNRIFIVLTLGLYAPWAKVRTLRYFYSNTKLDQSPFQFNANPWYILRNLLIAFALYVVYVLVSNINSTAAFIAYFGLIAAYFIFMPIVIIFVMSFNMRYSSWRGINFNFNNDYRGAYRVYLAPLLIILLLIGSLFLLFNAKEVGDFFGLQLGTDTSVHSFIPSMILFGIFLLLLPYFDFINMHFLARNVRFGTAEVQYSALAKDYYVIYWRWLLATMLLGSLWIAYANYTESLGVLYWPLIIITLLYYPLSKAYLKSKRYNLLFGNTSFYNHKFQLKASVPFLQFFYILATNTIMVVTSLGLMSAWAEVRTVRFMLKHTELEAADSLDKFIQAQNNKEISAIGEELSGTFDINVGL